jgi:hypothetical protein
MNAVRDEGWYANHKDDEGARVEIYRANNWSNGEAYLRTERLYERIPMRFVSREIVACRLVFEKVTGRTISYRIAG